MNFISLLQLSRIESIKELTIEVRIENFDFNCFLNFKNLQALFILSERMPIEFIYKFVRQMKFSGYFRFWSPTLFRVGIDFGLRPEERKDPEGRPFYLWYDRYEAGLPLKTYLVHGDEFCHDLDELFRELAVMKEHELIKSFFI